MRNIFNKRISIPLTLSLVAIFLAVPHFAHADLFDIGWNTLSKLILLPYELLVLPLAAAIMTLAGFLMDTAIKFSLNTAYIFGLSKAVDLGWIIIRDIANIFFIFILIQISLSTIIHGTGFGTKDMLRKVIIAAILINFTLFLSKAAIDVSNIFGNWLYGGIQNTLKANSADQSAGKTTSLSALISARLGIMDLWSKSQGTSATANANSPTGISGYVMDETRGFMGTSIRLALVCFTTYIFIYIAVMFLARSVTLLFLLVFSPIAALGSILPQIKEYSDDWWKEFKNCLLFPIVFLLMLYISLQFINSLGTLNLNLIQDDLKIFGFNFKLSQYFQYFLVIFLLNASLSAAKNYSGKVGKMFDGVAKQLGGLAIGIGAGAATGGAAWLGRASVGQLASKMSGSERLNDMAAGKVGANAFTRFSSQVIGKAALGSTRGVSKASFDARNVAPFAGMTKGLGVDLGKAGGKDGYKGMVKEREEAEKKYAEGFGDDKEGLERRMAYAENRKTSILNRIALGDISGKTNIKLGEKLRGETGALYVKKQTEEAQKGAQKVKNQIIDEQMASDNLDTASKKDTTAPMDTALTREMERADKLVQDARKDEKNKFTYLAYNRKSRERQDTLMASGDPDLTADAQKRAAELDKEYADAMKNMNDADKIKLAEVNEKDVKTIEDLELFVESHKTALQDAMKAKDLVTKKEKIKIIKEGIKKNRIGEPAKWNKDASDGQGGFEGGTGLQRELSEKKNKIEEARREQNIMEGKGKVNQPKKDKGPKKADDSDDDDNT